MKKEKRKKKYLNCDQGKTKMSLSGDQAKKIAGQDKRKGMKYVIKALKEMVMKATMKSLSGEETKKKILSGVQS